MVHIDYSSATNRHYNRWEHMRRNRDGGRTASTYNDEELAELIPDLSIDDLIEAKARYESYLECIF